MMSSKDDLIGLESESKSIQDLANQLPEADALPDGFSEAPLDESNPPNSPLDPSKQTLEQAAGTGLLEVDPILPPTLLKDLAELGLEDDPNVGLGVEAMAVPGEMPVSQTSDGLCSSPVNVAPEKIRRFPVPLSEGDSAAPVDMAPVHPKKSLKAARLDLGEGREAAGSAEKGLLDRLSEAAKARKQQVKEVRLMLDENTRTSDDKVQLLNLKYQQQVAEVEELEKVLLNLRDSLSMANKQKNTFSADLNKNVALRQKLESLCRELQRQNKILLEESKKVAAEEQQKRQELSTKFHDTIKEITIKMEEQGDERAQQIKENDLLRQKLNHFMQQYELREQHFAHQLQTKSLELQLLEVKLKQQQELFFQEECKVQMYTEQISQLRSTEQDLRSQLTIYGEKFEQFQETLTKSNEVFTSFKQEMEKMSQTIKRLEKENASLRKKCEKSDVSIIELLDERVLLRKQLETTKNQKEKLEALCRSLHAECKQKSVVVPSAPPAPEEIDQKRHSEENDS